MYKWNGRVGIVTGASSPVGLAICRNLVEHGMTICAITKNKPGNRGKSKIEAMKRTMFGATGKLFPFECDICDETQLKAVFRWIGEKYDGIDLLVNNANINSQGLILDEKNTAEMVKIMETNILALCIVTREAVKLMKDRALERKDLGHIIVVNSIFGHKVASSVPGAKPMNGLYPASKYAATAITECVRQELLFLNDSVKITSICPGLIESDINRKKCEDGLVGLMPSLAPEDVASAVTYAISVKEHVQIHEIIIKPVGEFL